MRKVLLFTFAAAFVVFCIVQDRVTADGARRYVSLQRAALRAEGPAVTVNEVMRPAVARSVRVALLSSGAVVAVGLIGGLVVSRARSRWPDA